MRLGSLEEAMRDFEIRTGERINLRPDLVPYCTDTNDFMFWKIEEFNGEQCFIINQTYGNAKNLIPFIAEMCRINNIEWVATTTKRNPETFVRKYGFMRLPAFDYVVNGEKYYVLALHTSAYLKECV